MNTERSTNTMEYIIPDKCNEKQISNSFNDQALTDKDNNHHLLDYGENINASINKTPIQEFYIGQTIFITGGTGFLGKVLIEKLLRSCPEISKMYLLIRSKNNINSKDRLNNIFKCPLYDRLKAEFPNFQDKIVLMAGDCSIEGLGISSNDKSLLIREVSIIFHVAATVRFNDMLTNAIAININATSCILDMAKRMKKLKSFIHVSTVFVDSCLKHINESFTTYPVDLKTLISLSNENNSKMALNNPISQWPNTYACTKAIAEATIRDKCGNLPMGIFRPSLVISAAREPIPGWVENFTGPMGLISYSISGFLRFLHCNQNLNMNVMPVDFTINGLIAAAWDVSNHPERRGKNMLIYNSVSKNDAHMSYKDYFGTMIQNSWKFPLTKYIWLPIFINVKGKITYEICIWLFHLLPALLVDAIRICLGLKPRMWRYYKKVHYYSNLARPICNTEWTYTDNNIKAMWRRLTKEDQHLFYFNMKGFDWPSYLKIHFIGMRTYLFNEDMSTLDISRVKFNRLYWLHQAVKTLFIFGILWIIWILFV